MKTIKIISAITLMLCFFLPLSQCSYDSSALSLEVDEKSEQAKEDDSKATDLTSTLTYIDHVPYESVDVDDYGSLLIIVLFFWPLPLLLLQFIAKSRLHLMIICMVEIICAGICIYYVYDLVFNWGNPLLAGYLALGSIMMYFLMAIVEEYNFISKTH